MICPVCNIPTVKAGFYGKMRVQRFKCNQCKGRFSETLLWLNGEGTRLPKEKVLLILHCLAEGNSIRSTARIANVEKRTVINLLLKAGRHCQKIADAMLKNISVQDVQADEIWTYVRKKEGHKRPTESGIDTIGDAYVFIGIERSTKLVLAWHMGKRSIASTEAFIAKLADATAFQPYQISTDGFIPYAAAIDRYLTSRGVDYGKVTKVYGKVEEGREARYSPAEVTEIIKTPVLGLPDMERACTSHIERQNGSLRQWCKRLTRLTYAFSKRWENLQAALSFHFCYYNFVRIHSSLRCSPAMAANITNRLWSLEELISTI